ncbi:MAG: ABC transporter ATP-binding protein [Sphaerochaetaceae bacterium]|nr:ABC transporter ATP-binding protein [Sphaerochaetaceae bacterium]MDD3162434.1 ABC transporter ATP-binding protein [Sphaerochaetaceae bacterium]
MMDYAIEIEGLVKTYPRFALDHIDLKVPEGYVMGFIGENGAGKTTTIKTILSLISPEAGQVKVLGKRPEEALSDVGSVLNGSCYPDGLTMKDMQFILSHQYKNWDSKEFARYLDMFSIDTKQKFGTLSTGMKMKGMLAAALSHHAKLLVLDEPTSGLDPVFRDELLGVLQNYMQDNGNSIFFSSHIVSDIEKISDYVTMIHEGRIVFSETKEELLDGYRILCLSAKDMGLANKKKMIGLRKTEFGAKALVRTEDFDDKKYTLERATIEEIMLYWIKKEEARR